MNDQPAATPTPPAAGDVTGIRIVAALIDIVLLFVVFIIMAALFGDTDSKGDSSFSVNLSGLPALVYFVIVIGYYVVLESSGGQTLGKKIMGLKVVALDGTLTKTKVVVRTLLRIVDGLPFLYLVGIIAIVASKQKQRIGDMAAGTVVVRA
jgi:uncharacterized RDD family membrane protein YckC